MAPAVLLGLLIGLHVLLATLHHRNHSYFPGHLIHFAHTVVVDQTRLLDGYVSISPRGEDGQDSKAIFDGRRESGPLLSDPSLLWRELTRGRLRGLWRSPDYWNDPSLSFFLPAVIHELSGGSILAVALTPQIFLALIMLSIYGIARRAAGPWVGLAAAAVASGYPGIVELAYTHHDSLATGAMAVAVVCLLQYSDGFSRLGISVLAGVALFVSSCVGESIAGFMLVGLIVVGPLLVEMVRFLSRTSAERGHLLRGVVGLVFFVAPAPLLLDWSRVIEFTGRTGLAWDESTAFATVGAHVPESCHGLAGFLAYFFEMTFDYIQPLMTLWLVAGAALLYRAPRGGRFAVALSVAVPLVLLSLMPKKAAWYVFPVLPGLAVVTALGLRGLRSPKIRRGSLGLAAACGIATPLFYTFAPPEWHSCVDVDRVSPLIKSTIHVCGLSADSNWNRPGASGPRYSRLATAGHELVALDRQRIPRAEGARLVAVYGPMSHPLEGFRYVVELTQPELFVIDFLNPTTKPRTRWHMLTELEDAHFDYLVIVGSEGDLQPLPSDTWDPLLTRFDWCNGFVSTPQLERDALLRYRARSLLRQGWRRVELTVGPVYVAVDDPD